MLFRSHFDILYGQGISREGEIITLGVQEGIVEKAGAWYSYNGDRIGQGRENAKTFLKENVNVANEIEESIRASSQKDLTSDEENEVSEDKETQKTE